MENVELNSQTRKKFGSRVKSLRADGWIPAVLYGAGLPSKSIQIEERALMGVMRTAGATSLVNLFVDDEPEPYVVLAREIQRDILTGRLQHVDFFQVRLDQMIKTMPSLELVGESPLVRSGGAVLVHILNQVEVECLPTHLIDSIPVDITGLEKLDDTVTIGDLPVPPEVTILADPGDVVVSVVPPRAALVEEVEEEEALLEEYGVEMEEMPEEEMDEMEEEAEPEA